MTARGGRPETHALDSLTRIHGGQGHDRPLESLRQRRAAHGDAMTIVAFSFGLIAAFAAHGVCWAFMQMVFPDYTYWLIGA